MVDERTHRFNVQLDDEHAAKLHAVAERTYVQPGTLARSLLSTALDAADPESGSITELLDSIPGAFERAETGRRDANAGRAVPLEEL
jgi:predicted transcriptional regulator